VKLLPCVGHRTRRHVPGPVTATPARWSGLLRPASPTRANPFRRNPPGFTTWRWLFTTLLQFLHGPAAQPWRSPHDPRLADCGTGHVSTDLPWRISNPGQKFWPIDISAGSPGPMAQRTPATLRRCGCRPQICATSNGQPAEIWRGGLSNLINSVVCCTTCAKPGAGRWHLARPGSKARWVAAPYFFCSKRCRLGIHRSPSGQLQTWRVS